MRNVWEVGIHANKFDQKPYMIVHVECNNETDALMIVSEEFNLGSNEAIASRGRTAIDDNAPYLQLKPAGYGSNSAAVGLVGGAALGAAVGGPVGAIVGGVVGAMLGKEHKGVG